MVLRLKVLEFSSGSDFTTFVAVTLQLLLTLRKMILCIFSIIGWI